MESITLLEILKPLVSVADVVTRSIHQLSNVKAAHCSVPIEVTTLIGQLYIVQAALDQLCDVPSPRNLEHFSESQQLAVQFDSALQAFNPLVSALRSRIDQSGFQNHASLHASNKSLLVWDKREITEYLSLFERQANALNLLLQVTQCRSWFEQKQLIMTEQSQTILRLAQQCMPSSITQTARKSVRFETPCTTKSDFDFDFGFDFGFDALPSIPQTHRNVQRSYQPNVTEASQNSDDITKSKRPKYEEHKTREIGNTTTSNKHVYADTEKLESSQLHLQNAARIDTFASLWPGLSLHLNDSITSNDEVISIQVDPPSLHTLRNAANNSIERRASTYICPRQRKHFWKHNAKVESVELQARPALRAGKTLLLGISESGKTTFFKGCHLLDRKNTITQRDLVTYKQIIFTNLLNGIKLVLGIMDDLQIHLGKSGNERHMETIFSQNSLLEVEALSEEVQEAVAALWADTGFQEAFRNSHEYQLCDNFDWFASTIPRIGATDYKPSIDDFMRVQIRTTGVATTDLVVNQSCLTLVDVGGTRVERRKWKHVYRNASSVFFIVDADAYDKPLEEDFNSNRMQEQLLLFDVTINSQCFNSVDFVVVFSKIDLLSGHLKNVHPQRYMPDFEPCEAEGAPSVNEYMTYLENKFLTLIKDARRRADIRILRLNLVDIELYTQEIL